MNPPLFLPHKFFPADWFSCDILFQEFIVIFDDRIPCFYVGIFLQDYFRGQRHRLLDDNIGGELIPNRLNHALQINASLVDLVDKDNGGNVHFPQGMEQNTGLGLHAIFSGDHQDGPI